MTYLVVLFKAVILLWIAVCIGLGVFCAWLVFLALEWRDETRAGRLAARRERGIPR